MTNHCYPNIEILFYGNNSGMQQQGTSMWAKYFYWHGNENLYKIFYLDNI